MVADRRGAFLTELMGRVLCLHGFTGAGDSWNEVRRGLPPGTEVLAPDLLGHGTADVAGAGGFCGEVDRLAAELRARGWRHIHLAGYSLGGRVALGLLVRHPALFRSATLIGVHPGLATEPERAARRVSDEALARRLESQGIAAFVGFWESLPLFATQRSLPPAALAAQRRQRLRHRPAGLACALRVLGLGSMPCFRPELPFLDLPVRLMTGELDVKFRQLAVEMSALLPRAVVEVVPSTGHNLVLEDPSRVAAVLRLGIRAPDRSPP